jgi:hypothetical protein
MRVRGPEHPDTLTARRQLTACAGQAEDVARPRDQLVVRGPSCRLVTIVSDRGVLDVVVRADLAGTGFRCAPLTDRVGS